MLSVLATIAGTTMVGAAGGWTAWSEPVADGTWALVTRAPDGTLAAPDVRPRMVPFDVDLGVDESGHVIAAFSQCKREPIPIGGANPRANGGLPQYSSGRGCSIRLLDVASGQRRIVERFGASEVLPSLSGSTLAVVSVPKGKTGANHAVITIRKLGGQPRQLWSGRRVATATGAAEGVTSVDTNGRSVTWAWRHANHRDGSFDSDILVQRLSAKKQLVAQSATSTEDTPYVTALGPTLAEGAVTYVLSFGGHGFCSRRYSPTDAGDTYGVQQSGISATPASTALDGARLVVGLVDGAQTQVVAYDQGPFTSAPDPGQICG